MIKSRFAVVLVAALSLVLAACSSKATVSDEEALASIAWSADDGGAPVLTFDPGLAVTDAAARVIEDGTGSAVQPGQIVVLDYVVYGGADAAQQFSTFTLGTPESFPLVEEQVSPALWSALQGVHVGAHLLFATFDASAPAVDGVFPTIVLGIIVSDAVDLLERAEGEAVAPPAGLPVVTLAENGAPSIDFTGASKPAGLVVQPLIVGSGATVEEGQSLTVHYTGWLWDGEQFDSSWDRGASSTFALAQGQLIDGWVDGLAGQTVGSQVLLIVPPELGYGDSDQGSIPPGSTLVFVVDILAAI